MKIAMIGQKGIPADSGGVEKHVEELAWRFVRDGHEVTVYCRNTYVKEEIKEYKGIKLKLIKTINNKNLDAIIYTLRATLDALRQDFSIYHYHGIGPASLSFIPALLGKKVIVTVHGLDWQRDKWGKFAKFYLKFGEFITGKFAHRIISVSENLKNYFIGKYNRSDKDVVFISNGVNIYEPLLPNEIKKYDLIENNYILFLARLVPEKGSHYLIEAYNQLKTDKKLVIAGGSSFTDDYVDKLKAMAENNPNIIFTGNVNGDLLRELYSNCYMYVLPSDVEGMPLTLLEALSYGKTCLVSNIEENKYVICNDLYGELFDKGNVDDLSNKMKYLLERNANYKQKEIKSYICKKFSWENILALVHELYQNA